MSGTWESNSVLSAFVIRYNTLNPSFFFFFPHLQLRENSVNQAFSPVHARTLALKVSPVGTDVATMKSWPQGNFLRFCYGQVLPRKC